MNVKTYESHQTIGSKDLGASMKNKSKEYSTKDATNELHSALEGMKTNFKKMKTLKIDVDDGDANSSFNNGRLTPQALSPQ